MIAKLAVVFTITQLIWAKQVSSTYSKPCRPNSNIPQKSNDRRLRYDQSEDVWPKPQNLNGQDNINYPYREHTKTNLNMFNEQESQLGPPDITYDEYGRVLIPEGRYAHGGYNSPTPVFNSANANKVSFK